MKGFTLCFCIQCIHKSAYLLFIVNVIHSNVTDEQTIVNNISLVLKLEKQTYSVIISKSSTISTCAKVIINKISTLAKF